MKILVYTALAFFISASALAQTDLLKEKIVVGEFRGETFTLLIDKNSFLEAFNKHFDDKVYTKIDVKRGETIGEKKISFYYLIVASEDDTSIVRWLAADGKKLYMDNTFTNDDYTHKNYFVSCEGVDKCQPRLYATAKEMNWICGETLGCVTEEEAKRNPCVKSISVVAASF